jgi:hypothetical protein
MGMVVAQFKVLSQRVHEGSQGNYKKPQSDRDSNPETHEDTVLTLDS